MEAPAVDVGRVTVVRPRASTTEVVTAGVGALAVVFLGDLLEFLALVFVPVSRIPAVRRWLEQDDAAPDQLEVRDDAVTVVGAGGGTIEHAPGAVLTVEEFDGAPSLFVRGMVGAAPTLDVTGYDVDVIGRAVLAHGWSWQPPGGAATHPPAARGADDAEPAFEVLLREGWVRPIPSKAIVRTVLAAVVVAVVGHLVLAFAGLPAPYLYLVVPGVAVLAALCVIALALVWHRMSQVTFALDDRRVVVRYGVTAKIVVRKPSVVSMTAGRRWLRVKVDGHLRATWLPIAPRRRELVSALRSHGWRVTEEA